MSCEMMGGDAFILFLMLGYLIYRFRWESDNSTTTLIVCTLIVCCVRSEIYIVNS